MKLDGAALDTSIRRTIRESAEMKLRLLEEDLAPVSALARALVESLSRGGKLLLFGNGGSAADAQHVAAEFVNRFRFDRAALPALALTVDSSILTAIGNDSSFDLVFARQVEALAREGDVVAGITTSGSSRNVVEGLAAARAKGATTVAVIGAGGDAERVADICLRVPSKDTARIQEAHITLWHAVCEVVERALVGPSWGVFLDRDGTINEEVGYLGDPERVSVLPGAAEAIRRLNMAGVPAIVVTNQSAIGRGYFAADAVDAVNARLAAHLRDEGARLDGFYVCPHRPDEGCECRKPEPGLLLQAAHEHGLDVGRSFLIGDKESDLASGKRAGCRTVLVRTGYGSGVEANGTDFVADDLGAAVDWILASAG